MSGLRHLKHHASRNGTFDDVANKRESEGVDPERIINSKFIHARAQQSGHRCWRSARGASIRCTALFGFFPILSLFELLYFMREDFAKALLDQWCLARFVIPPTGRAMLIEA